jgi:histidine triad (HIT) family protein
MTEKTLFSKIIAREIPADIVFQDERVTAFRDINPQAPTHILIVPNKAIPTVNDVTSDDENTLGHLFIVAKKLAKDEGIAENGYRLLINCGVHGHQEVFHLHMHLVGGKPLGRMLSNNTRQK